jgi:hypothetical protein
MSGITPLYGIHHPDGATKVVNLGAELTQFAADVEATLAAALIPPATPAPVMVAASALARDEFWGVPGTEAARMTLQRRGAQTIRTDKGWTEQYYATYNATTNPAGATPAGWYPVAGSLPDIRLVPSGGQTVGAGQTFTAWAPAGTGRSVRRGGADYFTHAGGVITVTRAGIYDVACHVSVQVGSGAFAAYLMAGPDVIDQQMNVLHANYGLMSALSAQGVRLNAGTELSYRVAAGGPLQLAPGANGTVMSTGQFSIRFVGAPAGNS